jgi:aspartyl protease family protein
MLIADPRGHFGVEPAINGTHIRMMVDTGASSVVLTEKDAHALGINPETRDFSMKMATANGTVLVAPTVLPEIAVEGIVLRDVGAVVVPEDRLQVSLLGMSFLSRLTRFEVSGNRLILTR